MINRIKNVYYYIVDTSKYYIQDNIEKHARNGRNENFVLMFHDVSNNMEAWDDPEFSISSDSFKKLIVLLEEEGFNFCTPQQFFIKDDRKKILITFDDAYRGIYTEVFPYLKKKQIPFIVFQTVSFINQEKYLDENMIKEMLLYDLFSLGTHTISHCNLHECKNSQYEISEPKEIFKDKFGVIPSYFAYPYGAFVTLDFKHVIYAKREYKAAFSTCNISYDKMKFKYLIPRVNINESNYLQFCQINKE